MHSVRKSVVVVVLGAKTTWKNQFCVFCAQVKTQIREVFTTRFCRDSECVCFMHSLIYVCIQETERDNGFAVCNQPPDQTATQMPVKSFECWYLLRSVLVKRFKNRRRSRANLQFPLEQPEKVKFFVKCLSIVKAQFF